MLPIARMMTAARKRRHALQQLKQGKYALHYQQIAERSAGNVNIPSSTISRPFSAADAYTWCFFLPPLLISIGSSSYTTAL